MFKFSDRQGFHREAIAGLLGEQEKREFYFRLEDILENPEHFEETATWLEKHGYIVEAQTEEHPDGHFHITDGFDLDDGIRLNSCGHEHERVISVRATPFPEQVSSQVPEPPRHKEGGLRHIFTHTMALAVYRPDEKGEKPRWGKSYLMPSGKLALSQVNNTGAQYAQGAFEGCVAVSDFGNPDDPKNFGKIVFPRLRDNALRFQRSCKAIGAPAIPVDQFIQTVLQVVRHNLPYMPKYEEAKLYIRPYVIGTKGGAGASPAQEYLFGVEVFPFGEYLSEPAICGRLDLHRPPKGRHKVGANYSDSFAEKKKKRNSLPSITRDSILTIARLLGMKVEVRDIPYSEISEMVGCLSAGNAAGITRVKVIDIYKNEKDPSPTICRFDHLEAAEKITELKHYLIEARKGRLKHPKLRALNGKWIQHEIRTQAGELLDNRKEIRMGYLIPLTK